MTDADLAVAEGDRVQPTSSVRISWRRRVLSSPLLGVAASLVAILAVFTMIAPTRFGTPGNVQNLFADTSVMLVLAMPTTLLLISRQIDLSLGSVIAFSEVVAVKVMIGVGSNGLFACLVGLAVTVLVGAAWGAINGLLVARAGLPSFVVTLATMGAALGAALVLSGGNDIAKVPPTLVDTIGVGTVFGVPLLALIAVAVVVATAWTLRNTRFGRHSYAIGSDPTACQRAGIDVRAHLVKIYVIAGATYGVAAYLNVARFSTTTIAGHTADALNAITGVALGGVSIFGGVGSAVGSAIGIFIPSVLQNGLVVVGVPPYWQQIGVAAALVAAVYADHWRRRAGRRDT